jgi:uncharacterized protein (DUF1330 family)
VLHAQILPQNRRRREAGPGCWATCWRVETTDQHPFDEIRQPGVVMTAYVIAHFTIEDEVDYALYRAAFRPVFERYGGRFLAVDDNAPILEGSAKPGRTVLLAFADKETARAWYKDPEYQAIAVHRRAGTEMHILAILGERPERPPSA